MEPEWEYGSIGLTTFKVAAEFKDIKMAPIEDFQLSLKEEKEEEEKKEEAAAEAGGGAAGGKELGDF